MRSPPSLPLAALLATVGCGADTTPTCERSFLRYDNFGSPFIANWCRACHSADLPAGMRQQAPTGVDFDSLAEIRRWAQLSSSRPARARRCRRPAAPRQASGRC